MSLDLNDESWAYWVRLTYWKPLEAALILNGIIPSKRYFHELEFEMKENASGRFSTLVREEPTTSVFLSMINRQFDSKKITPRECLGWAQNLGIELDNDLLKASSKYKPTSTMLREKQSYPDIDETKSGRHWIEMRNNILSRALFLINDPPEEYAIFHKSSGKINITKLSTAVFEFGHELRYKKGGNIALDTIYDTLKKAIKPSKKLGKTGK